MERKEKNKVDFGLESVKRTCVPRNRRIRKPRPENSVAPYRTRVIGNDLHLLRVQRVGDALHQRAQRSFRRRVSYLLPSDGGYVRGTRVEADDCLQPAVSAYHPSTGGSGIMDVLPCPFSPPA